MSESQISLVTEDATFQTVTNISHKNFLSEEFKQCNILQHPQESTKIRKSMVRTASLQSDEEYIFQHDKIFLSGRYNFEGCKIPLKSNLNIDYFRFMLYGYEDEAICDFLEYGFPLGYMGKIQQQNPNSYTFVQNHSGAKQFAEAVQKYLVKEKLYGAILGPFTENPFMCNIALSPLNTVPKRNLQNEESFLI